MTDYKKLFNKLNNQLKFNNEVVQTTLYELHNSNIYIFDYAADDDGYAHIATKFGFIYLGHAEWNGVRNLHELDVHLAWANFSVPYTFDGLIYRSYDVPELEKKYTVIRIEESFIDSYEPILLDTFKKTVGPQATLMPVEAVYGQIYSIPGCAQTPFVKDRTLHMINIMSKFFKYEPEEPEPEPLEQIPDEPEPEFDMDIPELLETYWSHPLNSNFPKTYGYTMQFYQGHSFYIPFNFKIDERLSYLFHEENPEYRNKFLIIIPEFSLSPAIYAIWKLLDSIKNLFGLAQLPTFICWAYPMINAAYGQWVNYDVPTVDKQETQYILTQLNIVPNTVVISTAWNIKQFESQRADVDEFYEEQTIINRPESFVSNESYVELEQTIDEFRAKGLRFRIDESEKTSHNVLYDKRQKREYYELIED